MQSRHEPEPVVRSSSWRLEHTLLLGSRPLEGHVPIDPRRRRGYSRAGDETSADAGVSTKSGAGNPCRDPRGGHRATGGPTAIAVACAALLDRPQPRFWTGVRTLHGKCAVADRKALFLSSANMTECALDRNMELGILVMGGDLPGTVVRHFESLVLESELRDRRGKREARVFDRLSPVKQPGAICSGSVAEVQ